MAANSCADIVPTFNGELAVGSLSRRGSRGIGNTPKYLKIFSRVDGNVMMGKAKYW